ncbi:MAG: ImmA/IrrE family metallo-endopeptidase [Cyanophyceae cyanobacterium]
MIKAQQTQRPFTPDWISPPGDTIADLLEELDWTQLELAERLNFSTKHISQLVHGKVTITSDTAVKLSQVLGGSVQFWLNREANYQAELARLKHEQQLKQWAPWLDQLPVKFLQQLGILRSGRITDKIKPYLVQESLKFFGCASPEVWATRYQRHNLDANFRQSASGQSEKQLGTIATWLRLGEIAARHRTAKSFDREKFKQAIKECRTLTQSPESEIQRLVKKLCNEAGVTFIFIPAITGARVSGVARWLNAHTPLIQVSLHGKTNDKFWFTFFHEAAHILFHGKDKIFVDNNEDGTQDLGVSSHEEQEADRWARNILIPEQYADQLIGLKSRAAVEAFAKKIGVHPGIVVGRLQYEKILPMTHLNHLKISYEFESDFPSSEYSSS